MEEPVVDVPLLRKLAKMGIACRHCGNVVVKQGRCPMWFPRPDCLTDEAIAAARARLNDGHPQGE